jgi:TolA-binding protein
MMAFQVMETLEKRAASLFSLAKSLADAGKTDRARTRLVDIIKKYPDTLAAADAKELLDMIAK